jgi:Ras-related protein Rab-1A
MVNYDYLLKVVVTGDSAVGKSCMLARYTDGNYSDIYLSTIGVDFKIKTINIDDNIIKLQIWDTAGQERFKVIVNSYYRSSSVVCIVFALDSRESFMNVPNWYDEATRLSLDDTKVILVGCKSDLPWAVREDEIKQMADDYEMPWALCSARTGEGIEEVFNMLIRESADTMRKHRIQAALNESAALEMEKDRRNDCCVIL